MPTDPRDEAPEVPTDPLVAELESMLRNPPADLGAAAHGLVLRACEGDEDSGRQRLLALIDHLEGRAFDVSRVLAIRGAKEGLLLSRALEILDAIRDVGLTRLGEVPTDVVSEVDREEKWLADLASTGFETRDASLRGRLDRLIVERLNSLAKAPPRSVQPGTTLRVIAEAVGDLMERGQVGMAEQLGSVRARLWRSLLERARELGDGEVQAWLRQLADEVNDRAEDVLARSESLSYEAAARLLGNAERDVRRAITLTKRLKLDGRRRELRRMRRRIRATIQDRRVRERQIHQVGRKALRTIEVLVFISIVGVLGILGYELFSTNPWEISDPVARQKAYDLRTTLAWIDAGICAFFLLEFTWRWALSRWSPFYLWRCFFIDVLPSIPFGLIAELMMAGVPRGDVARGLRAVRGVRLLRGLRIMRPLFQVYRLIAFTLQGMDRLARRNAALLNRNIVLFDPPEEQEEGTVSASLRLRRFRDRLARASRLTMSELPPAIRQPLARNRIEALSRRLDRAPHYEIHTLTGPEADLRDIRVEAVVEELLTLEAPTVEVHLGEESAGRLARVLRMLDIPVVRRLPLIRELAPGTAGLDPYQALAEAGHGLGRFLERTVERFRFFGDLTGIVTGSQLLDRVGTTLVRATQRPAVRLLMFGFAAILVSWFIDWFDWTALEGIANFLNKVLGTGVMVLGGICLAVQAFGRWIRKLAGETTELFHKVAEAQGINLVKFHKLAHRGRDLGLLFDRAVAPEVALDPSLGVSDEGDRTGTDRSPTERARERFSRFLPHDLTRPDADHAMTTSWYFEQSTLLYLDYLDGAVLHRSNVKSTEQFLGNLDIEAIRSERLEFDKKDAKRLRKLDLSKDRPIPTGPSLWFRFITESLSQRVAKLLLHYNRTVIRPEDRPFMPAHQVARMDEWLRRGRRPSTVNRPALGSRNPWRLIALDRKGDGFLDRNFWFLNWLNPLTWPFVFVWLLMAKLGRSLAGLGRALFPSDDGRRDPEVYGPAAFNALHFMAANPERDARVEREFGPEVRKRIEEDRRTMIREVFSSYPWEHLPRHRRTLNFYTLYFSWLGRGKVVFSPFRVLWTWLRWWGRALRSLGRLIAEQLRPEELRADTRPRLATLDVALRKINRMYLPVFMEALDLRARFDPEYLGLRLPGCAAPEGAFALVRDDLDLIGAREYRRERYREMRTRIQRDLRRLDALLEECGWPGTPLGEALTTDDAPRREVESPDARRAVAIAWVIDYKDCRTLITAQRDIERAFESFLASPGDARPKRGFWRKDHRRLFESWIATSPLRDRDEAAMDLLRRAYAGNRGRVRTLIKGLHKAGGARQARRSGLSILATVARHPAPWSRQLLTLRTVQSLCVLDILNARDLVKELGGYPAGRRGV